MRRFILIFIYCLATSNLYAQNTAEAKTNVNCFSEAQELSVKMVVKKYMENIVRYSANDDIDAHKALMGLVESPQGMRIYNDLYEKYTESTFFSYLKEITTKFDNKIEVVFQEKYKDVIVQCYQGTSGFSSKSDASSSLAEKGTQRQGSFFGYAVVKLNKTLTIKGRKHNTTVELFINPNTRKIFGIYSNTFSHQEDLATALQLYRMALKAEQDKEFDKVILYLEKSAKKDGGYSVANLYLGEILSQGNIFFAQAGKSYSDFNKAKIVLASIKKNDGNYLEALFYLAKIALHQKDNENAKKYLHELTESGHAKAYSELSIFYLDVEDNSEKANYYYEKAKSILLADVESKTGDNLALSLLNIAHFYNTFAQREEAEKYYLQLYALVENDKDVSFFDGFCMGIAVFYEYNQDFENAIKFYSKVKTFDCSGHIAACYHEKKMYDYAEHYYKVAIKNGDYTFWYFLGRLYKEQNMVEKAVEAYQKSIELGNYHACVQLALLIFKSAPEESIRILSIGEQNGNAGCITTLNMLYCIIEDFDNCEKYCLKTIKMGGADANEGYIRLGDLYLTKNKKREAIKCYEQSVEGYKTVFSNQQQMYNGLDEIKNEQYEFNFKSFSGASLSLATVYFDIEEYTQATEVLMEVINTAEKYKFSSPRYIGLAFDKLGDIYDLSENYNSAEKYYFKSVEINASEDAYAKLGRFYMKNKKLDDAEKYMLKAKEAGDFSIGLDLGDVYAEMGKIEKAEKFFLSEIQEHEDLEKETVETEKKYNILLSEQKYAVADSIKTKLEYMKIDLNYDKAMWSYVNLGNIFYQSGNFSKSSFYYKKAFESGYNDALFSLAAATKKLNQLEEAEIYYRKAIELKLDDASQELIYFFITTKQLEKLEKYYESAPFSIADRISLGMAFYDEKKYLQAEKHLFKAYSLGHHEAIIDLALIYSAMKSYDKAEEILKKGIAIDTLKMKAAPVLYALLIKDNRLADQKALLDTVFKGHNVYFLSHYLTLNNYVGEAEKLMENHIKAFPEVSYSYYFLAKAKQFYDPKNELGVAKESFEQFVQLQSKQASKDEFDVQILVEAHLYLADYYTKRKKNAVAQEHYKAILAIQPENEIAKNALKN